MRELIQVVLQDLSVDEIKSMAENALLKVWAQRSALANRPEQRAIRDVSGSSPLYPAAFPLTREESLPAPRQRSAVQRFWGLVNKTDTCWLWKGHRDRKGVPRFDCGKAKAQKRKATYAHRFAWELEKGPLHGATRLLPISECTNGRCVRPDHRHATRSYKKRPKQNIAGGSDTVTPAPELVERKQQRDDVGQRTNNQIRALSQPDNPVRDTLS